MPFADGTSAYRLHHLGAKPATIFSKRGSPRSGSQCGWVLVREIERARDRDKELRRHRSCTQSHHTNIVHIYDVGEHDGTPFFAME